MKQESDTLKLGKGAAFVKSRLKRLRQEDETWEADFRALPKPLTQSHTNYLGMVVTEPDGFLLADTEIQGRPSVNDLATLLANSMKRPLTEGAHRPTRLHLRGHHQWRPLFPHLKELGIDVAVQQELPKITETYEDYLRQMKDKRSRGKAKPTMEQMGLEKLFPAVAQWVNGGYGHIEIGDQEGFGFIARALDYGGLVFEDDKPSTLAESLATLEKALAAWFDEQGIDAE